MKYIKKYAPLLILPIILIAFMLGNVSHINTVTYAQENVTSTTTDPGDSGTTTGPGQGEPTTGPGDSGTVTRLSNPLESDDITEFLLKIIDVILIFAVPIIILFIMYAGFLFVTARGDVAQITKARTTLLWAIVGGVIVLGAKIIIEVIEGTIRGF